MATTRVSRPEPVKLMRCENGHAVRIRVDRKGNVRGDGKVFCPRCESTDLTEPR